jgi:predicted nucleotidyltransferase component of viral defense system
MTISREALLQQAADTGFSPAMLEKVLRLLAVLDALNRHPATSGKLALKGGTALNLFLFDVPRLSVDIDLNYVGAADRETMLGERPAILAAVKAICRREGLTVRNEREDHAATALDLRYESAIGGKGNLKIDLNFITRVPLWEPRWRDARPLGATQIRDILVIDTHELAAGKLAALLSRQTSRDLFDAHALLVAGIPGEPLDRARLRVAFTVYGGFNPKDWRTISPDDVERATDDLKSNLAPLLRRHASELHGSITDWAAAMIIECREALRVVLPLSEDEREFIERLNGAGVIAPELLTVDEGLAGRIEKHPALLWKALNVQDFMRGVKRNARREP